MLRGGVERAVPHCRTHYWRASLKCFSQEMGVVLENVRTFHNIPRGNSAYTRSWIQPGSVLGESGYRCLAKKFVLIW